MIPWSRKRSFGERKKAQIKWNKRLLFFIALFLVFFIVTTIFMVPIKQGSVSMAPTVELNGRVIVSPVAYSRSITTAKILPDFKKGPQRGDIVLVVPSYYPSNSKILNFINPAIRFLTFQQFSFSSHTRLSWENNFSMKRIIAVPGDTIKINDFIAYVKPKGEDYFLSEFELIPRIYDIVSEELPEYWSEDYPLSGEVEPIVLTDNEYFILGDNRTSSSDSRHWGTVGRENIVAKVLLQYWPLSEFGRP